MSGEEPIIAVLLCLRLRNPGTTATCKGREAQAQLIMSHLLTVVTFQPTAGVTISSSWNVVRSRPALKSSAGEAGQSKIQAQAIYIKKS